MHRVAPNIFKVLNVHHSVSVIARVVQTEVTGICDQNLMRRLCRFIHRVVHHTEVRRDREGRKPLRDTTSVVPRGYAQQSILH